MAPKFFRIKRLLPSLQIQSALAESKLEVSVKKRVPIIAVFPSWLWVLLLTMVFSQTVTAQQRYATHRIRPSGEHLLFKVKALINPATGTSIDDAIVETNGGRILRVGHSGDFEVPANLKVMDFGDKYVIPGLIDTHGHLYWGVTHVQTTIPALAVFYLAAGVTSIGDPGSMDPGSDLALRNRIDSGVFPGPRYYLAGEYLDMAPLIVPWMNPVATAEEARLKVDLWASQGATAIKLYANMHGEVMQAAIEEAHAHGMRVWAHIGTVSYHEAIEMGVDQIFHGVLTMSDTRAAGATQADYKNWSVGTGKLDLTRPEIKEDFKMAAAGKVVFTPTAVVMEPPDLVKNHMSEQMKYYSPQAWDRIQKLGEDPRMKSFMNPEAVQKNREFIRRAHEAGCMLATGTDLVLVSILPGFSLWREMEIFAEAGLKPMEVLKAATVNGAYAIGRSDQLGTVEPGKLADFVVLTADPRIDISNVRSVYRVVKGGVLYDPQELLQPMAGAIE